MLVFRTMPRKTLALLCTSVLLFSCTGRQTERRLESLEAKAKHLRILDMRLSHTEDRVTIVEEEVGRLQDKQAGITPKSNKKGVAAPPQAPRNIEPTPVAATPMPPAPANSASAQVSSAPVAAQPAASSVVVAPPAAADPVDSALSSLAALATPEKKTETTPLSRGFSGTFSTQDHATPASATTATPASATTAAPVAAQPRPVAAPVAQPRNVESSAQLPDDARPQGALAKYKTGQAGYDRAIASFDTGKYDTAYAQFDEFAAANPNSKLMPNVYYWKGESRYSTKQYDQAILLFKEVAAKFPKHPKAADALLKAGMAYMKLGDKQNAHFYWQILTEDFPGTRAANLAKGYMK